MGDDATQAEQATVSVASESLWDEDLTSAYHKVRELWIRDQRIGMPTEALIAARRLADRAPQNAHVQVLLGFVALSARCFKESYLALMQADYLHPLEITTRLACFANFMMRGEELATLNVDGVTYRFPLSAHTTQMIETGAAHCAGELTELEELRYLNSVLKKPEVMVEVGVLCGNHSAYFLQNFQPTKLILIEADPSMHPILDRTVAANNPGNSSVQCHTAFVGKQNGLLRSFADATVPERSLSSLISEPIDFLKVDVDGAELDVLAGAESLILDCQPFVMIETEQNTDLQVQEWFLSRGFALEHRIERGDYFNSFFKAAST
ncbi:MAG: FkbM family methyltransferase [Rhodospirillaceae bacterium]